MMRGNNTTRSRRAKALARQQIIDEMRLSTVAHFGTETIEGRALQLINEILTAESQGSAAVSLCRLVDLLSNARRSRALLALLCMIQTGLYYDDLSATHHAIKALRAGGGQ